MEKKDAGFKIGLGFDRFDDSESSEKALKNAFAYDIEPKESLKEELIKEIAELETENAQNLRYLRDSDLDSAKEPHKYYPMIDVFESEERRINRKIYELTVKLDSLTSRDE